MDSIDRGVRGHGVRPCARAANLGRNVYESLKDAGPGATASRKHERIRSILVVSEVALACMLLVGAGLLLRSFARVLDVDLGFQPDHAAAVKVDYDANVPGDKDGTLSTQKRSVIFQQVLTAGRSFARREGGRHNRLSAAGTEPLMGIAISEGSNGAKGSGRAAGLRDYTGLHARDGDDDSRTGLYVVRQSKERAGRDDQQELRQIS